MYNPPIRNRSHTFYVALTTQADTKQLQTNPTLAAGDVKVQTDDGSLANIASLPTGDASSKRVKVVLSASEMNGDNIWVQFVDAAGAEWCDLAYHIATVSAIAAGTVGNGSTTTSVVSSSFSHGAAATDQFVGRIIIFDNNTTTAALRGQAVKITSNTGSDPPTFGTNTLTNAPANGDTFKVY